MRFCKAVKQPNLTDPASLSNGDVSSEKGHGPDTLSQIDRVRAQWLPILLFDRILTARNDRARPMDSRAGDGDRTHDNHVGNVMLYH